ncbi:DoxX family protein [Humitalea sp. 24SJ18S-53]|uniref:DoxX family protein n=1 Tax=Humitalea sp. 24SJ18S-53 TaxID=3422307 RepID=UPI003D678AAE
MSGMIDRLCATLEPVGYLLLRIVVGANLVAHGWPKWEAGVARFATGLAQRGIEPSMPFAYLVVALEVIGGALIVLGLFTRPVAAVATFHLAFIAYWILGSMGYARWEYPAMWAVALFFVTLRGSGPMSLDALLFRRGR